MNIAFFFAGLLALTIYYSLIYLMDNSRISEELESIGAELVHIQWAPFGTGWFGEENDRIYKIIYIDKFGDRRSCKAKTSLFSGVYFRDDKIEEEYEYNPFDERYDIKGK